MKLPLQAVSVSNVADVTEAVLAIVSYKATNRVVHKLRPLLEIETRIRLAGPLAVQHMAFSPDADCHDRCLSTASPWMS